MEIKKNKTADTNRVRSNFFMIGFCYTSGLVLAAFSYQSAVDDDSSKDKDNKKSKTGIQQEDNNEPPPPPPPKIQEPQPELVLDLTQEIITIENKNVEDEVAVTKDLFTEVEEAIVVIEEPVVDFPDVEAEFKGGEAAMQRWMQENLVYPEISMEMGEQGKVYLKFVVEKDGKISSVDVIKGISRDLDNEAKRLVRAMPPWKAGETKGNKVRSSFTMPINFELN
ncbi:MAG: energy transducer TonB [Bacteroidetes bacterium]|nr:energy transducer TonB [Bacteroidota bacterium]